jgi:isoleucyl-tRNA synthetase
VLEILFERLTTWLAPVLVFTMEEVWLERHPGADSSVHLQDFPETPAAWRDEALAAKWAEIRRVRRVVTAALEVQRQNKVIGASLEAAPLVQIADPALAAMVKAIDMADLCITSSLTVMEGEPQDDAFRLDDPGIGVVFHAADGEKCARCWKILPDVGHHAHPGVCGRCDSALG